MRSLPQTRSIARGVVALALLLTSAATLLAQVPKEMTYQGILRTTGGVLVNGPQSIRFSLYTVAVGGVAIWTETQAGVNVVNGLFSTRLGVITPFPTAVNFSQQYWLQIEYPVGTPLTPRTQLAAAPYAIHSLFANSIPGAYQWTLAGGALFPSSPNTNIPVSIGGTGALPPSPGRLNTWGNPADQSVVRIEPGSGLGNFTAIRSGTLSSPATAIGLDLGQVNSTGADATGARVTTNSIGLGTGYSANVTSGSTAIGLDATVITTSAAPTAYGVRAENNSANGAPQYGVWGRVGSASIGAGVYAEGAGVAGPGVPNAAALELRDGAFNITGGIQAAGTVPAPALGVDNQCVVTINNPLVTPNSRILVTVEELTPSTPGSLVQVYAATVSSRQPGQFDVNYYAINSPPAAQTCIGAPIPVSTGVQIHYLIIGQ